MKTGRQGMKAYRFRYDIDEARRLIIFRVTGDVPSTVLNDKFVAAYRKIPDSARYDRLVDYRRYTGYLEFPDLEDFSRKMAYINRDHPSQYRVAIVTKDAFEQARLATLQGLFSEEMQAFSSMDDALDWLAAGRQTAEKPG